MEPVTEQVVLREWDRRHLPGVKLSPEGQRLAKTLSEGKSRTIVIRELADGLELQTRSWVGVVHLDGLKIVIGPKLAGDHLGLIRLIDWTSGIDALKEAPSTTRLDFEGSDLFDLLASLLVGETERLVRGGLRTAYRQRSETLPVLRGRLDISRQLRRRHGRIDRLECLFDERSSDITDNRLLLAAIDRCGSRVKNSDLRRRINRVRTAMLDSCSLTSSEIAERPVTYDRLNNHYRVGHNWARIILRGSRGLESFYRTGTGRCFAFFFDMNRLFEKFVEKALKHILAEDGLRVRFQHHYRSVVTTADSSSYKQLIPDVVLETTDPALTVPIDAKYKLYSERTVDPGDIAQTFLYAIGIGERSNDQPPRALIVFPSETGKVESEELRVTNPTGERAAEITVLGIPVAVLLDELTQTEKDLSRPITRTVRSTVLNQALLT